MPSINIKVKNVDAHQQILDVTIKDMNGDGRDQTHIGLGYANDYDQALTAEDDTGWVVWTAKSAGYEDGTGNHAVFKNSTLNVSAGPKK